jgi:oligoendopeptidase F
MRRTAMTPSSHLDERAQFIPAGCDCSSWSDLEPLYQSLLDRPLTSEADLRQWLRDFGDLDDAVSEAGVWAYFRHTCHTDDPQLETAYMHVIEEIEPQVKPLFFELQKKFLAAARATGLDTAADLAELAKRWHADVRAYCAENIPLQVQETKLATEYGKLVGAMTVEYRGRPHTLQEMARYLEEPERDVREESWRLVNGRRLRDREAIDRMFDDLLAVRGQIAGNAGHSDYRSYVWLTYKRFDYTPAMCEDFGHACEMFVRPLIEELDERAARDLGHPELRPWDLTADPKGRPPLRPFAPDDMAGFVEKTRRMFHRMSPS